MKLHPELYKKYFAKCVDEAKVTLTIIQDETMPVMEILGSKAEMKVLADACDFTIESVIEGSIMGIEIDE